MLLTDGAKGNEICRRGSARSARAAYACIGEHDIQASLFPADLRVDPVKVCRLGDVALNARDVRTDQGDRGIKLRLPAAGNVYIRPFFDELLCRGETDAATAASDKSNLAFEFFGHFFLRFG